MIQLTRLSGSQFVLNSDLIERVDATPDTVVTLTDGTKYVVSESLSEIVDQVRTFRSQIVALAGHIPVGPLDHATPVLQHGSASHLASVTPLPAGSPAADSDGQEL